MATFDSDRAGFGTAEWADINENIARGCAHNCLYCYASHSAIKRFRQREPGDWQREELTRKAFIECYPKRVGKTIMFPSAHDLTPYTIEPAIRVLKLMLDAGNEVLIVSKPHLDCTVLLLAELAPYKEQIMLRFTIGTLRDDAAAFWEPGAPRPSERVAALKCAFGAGFRMSVSCEPLLGGKEDAMATVATVRPYVTNSIWIGRMNKIRERVDMSTPQHVAAVEAIELAQSDSEMLALHDGLKDDPLIRWKDSIKAVLAKYGGSARAVIS